MSLNIAEFLRLQRKEIGLTQEELAKRSGVGLRLIRDMEQERRQSFGVDKVNEVLKIFGHELKPMPLDSSE